MAASFTPHGAVATHPGARAATDLGSPASSYLLAGPDTAAKPPPGGPASGAPSGAGAGARPAGTPPGSSAAGRSGSPPAPPDGGGTAPHSRRQIVLVFAGLILAVLISALDQTIVSTALPTIVGDLQGLDHLSWVITAYLLTSTIGLPIYGKLGDLLGRKNIFIFAIAVFLIGSALSGQARSMTELISYRALQGVGGGGLIIGAQAIIGDIVPARQRGRYMGLIGAAFGLASVSGPLLGGYLTEYWSWRWVFYINLPLGAVALAVIITSLHLPTRSGPRPPLDYLGAVLLAVISAALVMLTSWGGTTYAWTSPTILGLGAAAAVGVAVFIPVELRAAEPVLPLRLFSNRNFLVCTLVGLSVGLAMFGSISYLPTFLQMVNGASATVSGLMMLPMTAGLLLTSIGTGQLISRTGKYKIYPVLGAAVMIVGLLLLSRISNTTPYGFTALGMFVLGLGIGALMQNLVLIVQNSVPARDMGTGVSSANYFRQMGGSLGIAVYGSVFIQRLNDQVADAPEQAAGALRNGVNSISPSELKALPAPVQDFIARAFGDALPPIFLLGIPALAAGLILTLFIRQIPLSETSRVEVEENV
ncbi:MDR family MFS transporter [Arthrobacter sp. zg-Y1219]|uniref:MDR family MFS transporter n=1 Tax=Arthrobacter sp. zg-Y1219 TaxID=3049067 RepID=UPI0024C29F89|nr:MDR family MFS transporter [Arthrobacter sp. zg-Y1219]MDK1359139.1 MDR family MFS transporter [Arthrobacter sp. zg-Y1219]